MSQIAANLKSVVGTISIEQAILLLLPLLILLSWVRTMEWIALSSNIAIAALAMAIVIILYYGIISPSAQPIDIVLNVEEYPLAFGMFVFAFEGINLVTNSHNRITLVTNLNTTGFTC